MTQTEKIQLTLPAGAQYEEVAQTTIAHLAIRRGFTLKEVEDLRLIMAETTKLLLGSSKDNESLHLSYEVSKEQLKLEAHLEEFEEHPLPVRDLEHFTEIVGDLLDSFVIDNGNHHICLTKLRLDTES